MVKTAAPKPAAGSAPRGCTNFKLRQLTRRVSQHYDRDRRRRRPEDDAVLAALARRRSSARSRPGDLAAAMEIDASTLTRNLQPLVAHGWVEVGRRAPTRAAALVAATDGRPRQARRGAARTGSGRSSRSTRGSATRASSRCTRCSTNAWRLLNDAEEPVDG